MKQNDKTKFRASKKWKDFRDEMRKEQKTDPVTGQKLTRMANLHHKDMDDSHYEDLSNKDNFVFLNQMTHKCVHFLFSKVHPKQWRERIAALTTILEEMENLLIDNKGH